jgi:hypothetical protein
MRVMSLRISERTVCLVTNPTADVDFQIPIAKAEQIEIDAQAS